MFVGTNHHLLSHPEAQRFADRSALPLALYPLRT